MKERRKEREGGRNGRMKERRAEGTEGGRKEREGGRNGRMKERRDEGTEG